MRASIRRKLFAWILVGNGVAALKDSGSNTIDAASFNLTTGCTSPITISTGTSSDQVDVCCFRNGDAIAAWVQVNPPPHPTPPTPYDLTVFSVLPVQFPDAASQISCNEMGNVHVV